jgi:hypothetical protein
LEIQSDRVISNRGELARRLGFNLLGDGLRDLALDVRAAVIRVDRRRTDGLCDR